jgi:hypothetical protein
MTHAIHQRDNLNMAHAIERVHHHRGPNQKATTNVDINIDTTMVCRGKMKSSAIPSLTTS